MSSEIQRTTAVLGGNGFHVDVRTEEWGCENVLNRLAIC